MIGKVATLIATACFAMVAGAHHSFEPHFDSKKPVSISGKVTQYEARNPHSYLHVEAVDENGRSQEYICESHGVTQLTRNGITPSMLKPGTQLRIDGSQSRNDVHRCFFNNVYFPDGRALNVNGARGAPGAQPGQPAPAAREDIYGTWLLAPIPGRLTAGPQPMINSMTDAGKAAVAKYNPFKDDPAFRCDPVAIRRVWGAPGTPLSITREKDRVILRHEWMDVKRVVYLDQRDHSKAGKRTSLGHSIGHFEGDTLVIETGNLFGRRAEPVRGDAGSAHSRPAAFRRAHLGRARASGCLAPAAGG